MLALEQDVQHKLAQLNMLERQNQELHAKAQALELAVASSNTVWTLAQLPFMPDKALAPMPHQQQCNQHAVPGEPSAQDHGHMRTASSDSQPGPRPAPHVGIGPHSALSGTSHSAAGSSGSGSTSSSTSPPKAELLITIDSSIEELRLSYKDFTHRLSELLLAHDAASEAGAACLLPFSGYRINHVCTHAGGCAKSTW